MWDGIGEIFCGLGVSLVTGVYFSSKILAKDMALGNEIGFWAIKS